GACHGNGNADEDGFCCMGADGCRAHQCGGGPGGAQANECFALHIRVSLPKKGKVRARAEHAAHIVGWALTCSVMTFPSVLLQPHLSCAMVQTVHTGVARNAPSVSCQVTVDR